MSWYLPFGAWGKKETKEEADAKPEAPGLEADDAAAWNFYWTNAKAFVRDYGLMPMLLRELRISGVANREIFLEKVCAIHDMAIAKHAEKAKEDVGEKPDFEIAGAENG